MHVTVLHMRPITPSLSSVRAAVVQEPEANAATEA
jgi:hypothetical protein